MPVCLDTYARRPENRRMPEPIIDFLVRRLNEHKGVWPKISEETGVEYDTIAKIAQRRRPNPRLSNVQPLLTWFQAKDEMMARIEKALRTA